MSWDDGHYYQISAQVGKSRRYHSKMQQHNASLDKCFGLLTIFSSSGLFLALSLNSTVGGGALSALIAFLSALPLLYKFQENSATHGLLARRFTALAGEISKSEPTENTLRKFKAKLLEIEADEPPINVLVDIAAQNEEARSRGVEENRLISLSPAQETFGYFFTFGMATIRAERERRQRCEGSGN